MPRYFVFLNLVSYIDLIHNRTYQALTFITYLGPFLHYKLLYCIVPLHNRTYYSLTSITYLGPFFNSQISYNIDPIHDRPYYALTFITYLGPFLNSKMFSGCIMNAYCAKKNSLGPKHGKLSSLNTETLQGTKLVTAKGTKYSKNWDTKRSGTKWRGAPGNSEERYRYWWANKE